MAETDFTKTDSTRKLASHTILNLMGMGLPLLVGLVAFPILANGFHRWGVSFEGLDEGRFGAVGLVWMFVGYFSIFDMGLGRALTKLVAERLSRREEDQIPGLFWTAILLMVLFGIVAGCLLGGASPFLAYKWLKASDMVRPEMHRGFLIVALSMPIMILNVGLVGVLEACRRYGIINSIRLPAGCFTFLGPVLVLPYTNSLVAIVTVLVLGRVVEMVGYFVGCLVVLPSLRRGLVWRRQEVRPLLGFGGWMAVTNLVMQLMMHVNRLLIGMIRSVGRSGYYMVAEEMVVRIFIFPRAWISAIFPALVASFSDSQEATAKLYEKGMTYLVLMMFPVIIGIAVLAPEGFRLWLGHEFELHSTGAIRWLVVGVFIHSVARVPWFLIQAAGQPRRAALLHLVELPFYLGVACLLIASFGVQGAAMAWTFHKFVDLIGMLVLANKFVVGGRRIAERIVVLLLGAVAVLVFSSYAAGLLWRLLGAGLGCLAFYTVTWFWALSLEERRDLVRELQRVWAKMTA